jgi:hypothetical protein
MRLKNIVGMIVTGVSIIGICGCATTGGDSVVAKAKISKDEAQQIALAKVPNGSIKEGELEFEEGVLIWSFDIATPGTGNTTEVNINAVTGKVVGMDVESPEKEAQEAKAEPKKERKEKDDEDEKDEKK